MSVFFLCVYVYVCADVCVNMFLLCYVLAKYSNYGRTDHFFLLSIFWRNCQMYIFWIKKRKQHQIRQTCFMLLSLFHEKSIFDYSKIVTCIGRPQKVIGLADNPVFHFLLNLLFLIENCIIDLICFMGLNVPNFNSINFEASQKYWLITNQF